jgi:transcription antitermination factor NusG
MPERDRAWYAIHIKSNQERKTARFLTDRDVEIFLPTYRKRVRRSDRVVTLERPLFTGYLFARFDPGALERVRILEAPGTVRVVGFSGKATPVSAETIRSLQILVGDGGDQARPHPLIGVGKRVRVVDGPFVGAVGLLQQTADRRPRLVVEVSFLGRAVAVPVALDQLDISAD